MIFVETPVFTSLVGELMNDRQYGALQQTLANHPDAGALIKGGAGIRKLRWAMPSSGKRGGFRVIYYWRRSDEQVYMLYLFAKNARSDLSRQQIKELAEAARALK